MTTSIGFLGVGTIAAATVRGLRAAWPDLPIHLSPRSEKTSRTLADADAMITREGSNAAVVEASAVVVLSMLPTQVDDVVRDLPFRPDQIVVSCVAGTPLADVAALVAPARSCRMVPLPMIARRDGPIVLYPALPAIHDIFSELGLVIVPADERDFATFAAGSAAMSSFFALENAISNWMAARGAEPASASAYVRSLFRALGQTGLDAGMADVAGLVERHETPGGLNERVRRGLEAQGWFATPGDVFEALSTLRRGDLRFGEGA